MWPVIIPAATSLISAGIQAATAPDAPKQKSQIPQGGAGQAPGMQMRNTVNPNIAALMQMYNQSRMQMPPQPQPMGMRPQQQQLPQSAYSPVQHLQFDESVGRG